MRIEDLVVDLADFDLPVFSADIAAFRISINYLIRFMIHFT